MRPFLLFLGFVLVITSCKIPQEQNFESFEIAPEIARKIDSLDHLMWHYYKVNPDSAEIILFRTLDFLDTVVIPQKRFYVYTHLAQLYQYRKPDFFKAVLNLGLAMEIFVKYPGSYNSNCYVYVDIGNMFFYYGFHLQAIDFYRISRRFAVQSNDTWGQALAMQNIALSYQQLQQYDSTYHYLVKAEALAQNNSNLTLLLAQNHSYRANLSLLRTDSLRFADLEQFIHATFALYEEHFQAISRSENTSDVFRWDEGTIWQEIMSRNHRILSSFYFTSGKYTQAEEHLSKAFVFADAAGSKLLKANALLSEILHIENRHSDADLFKKAAQIDTLILEQQSNLYLKKEYADSMSALFARRMIPNLQAFYEGVARQVADSIINQKLSDEFTANMMLLSRISAEYSLQRLKLLEVLKTATIRNQNRVITVIILLSVAVIFSLLMFLVQKSKIDRANRAMLDKIKYDMRTAQSNVLPETVTRADMYGKFDQKLQGMIETEKSFLKKDLTLQDLAAMMNTNQTYISNYLNKYLGNNFNDFINRYRIKEACRLMLDPHNDNFTIEMLAHLSGFNSTSTFYTAFKKFTGMSPSAFKNNR